MFTRLIALLAILLVATACTSKTDTGKPETQAEPETTATRPAGIPEIDSSGWMVDPRAHGMTAKEYIQAESRAFFADFIGRVGLNTFFHFPGLASAEDRFVVSPNNDTVYSVAIVNARNGFTLDIPEVGERFVSTHIGDENHISPFYLYGGGTFEFKAEQFATDYVVVGMRTGTDGTQEDVEYIATELQPLYKISGADSTDDMARPDTAKMLQVREALLVGYESLPDTFGTMQSRTEDVADWEKFTYVSAGAWGLSKEENAMYIPYAKEGAKGDVCYTATYDKVPAEAFFSITVYGPDKYLMSNDHSIVSTNQGLVSNEDGTFKVAFGGMDCKELAPNFLYTPEDGWNFLLRAYKPKVDEFRRFTLPDVEEVN